jgi:hypothetical protein
MPQNYVLMAGDDIQSVGQLNLPQRHSLHKLAFINVRSGILRYAVCRNISCNMFGEWAGVSNEEGVSYFLVLYRTFLG